MNRDPRLYETFILDGDKYNGRTAALTEALASDPVNYPQGADWAQGGSTHVLRLPGLKKGLGQKEFREALLRERACEFGYEEVRFFDLIRWKLYNVFEKQLHGLHVYKHKDTGEYKFVPYELTKYPRVWWTSGFEPRWCLSAFPSVEINKGYGLVQNPGWE